MINDGGPAFPTDSEHQSGPHTWHSAGMTLRDYFAAKAMQALIPSGQTVDSMKYAESAYTLADAMLKARGEQ